MIDVKQERKQEHIMRELKDFTGKDNTPAIFSGDDQLIWIQKSLADALEKAGRLVSLGIGREESQNDISHIRGEATRCFKF